MREEGRWRACCAEYSNRDLVAKRSVLELRRKVWREAVCRELYFPLLLSPSPSPLSITDSLSVSISVSLHLHSTFSISLSTIDEWNALQGESGTEIKQTVWRKLLAAPTGIKEKIKRIFSINKPPILHVCVMASSLL